MSTNFKAFFFALPVAERESFAQQAGTSRGFLNQVAYGNKPIELGLANVIIALANSMGGSITLDDLRLTENAQRQREIIERKKAEAPPAPEDSAPPRQPATEHASAADNREHASSERRESSTAEYSGVVGLGRTLGRRDRDAER